MKEYHEVRNPTYSEIDSTPANYLVELTRFRLCQLLGTDGGRLLPLSKTSSNEQVA